MPTHHLTDGDDKGTSPRSVLAPLQGCEGVMRGVEKFDGAHELAHHRPRILQYVVVRRRAVEAPLGVKHVQSPDLVEPDGHIMPGLREGAQASRREEPG